MNIIEVIDSLLPQNILPIYFLELPEKAEGMLIEESGTRGQITSFNGYCGVNRSTIQFYIRKQVKQGGYNEILGILKHFYKLVQEQKGKQFENIKFLYVDEPIFSTPIKDKFGNYILSLDFSIIYKESE